jgi:hypothetical protein
MAEDLVRQDTAGVGCDDRILADNRFDLGKDLLLQIQVFGCSLDYQFAVFQLAVIRGVDDIAQDLFYLLGLYRFSL